MGMRVNLADQTVYPQSYKLHDKTVNMIANLWNCPKPDDFDEYGVFPGSGTVGSTEACLLAGLALKFRWRKWFAKKNNLSDEEVLGKRPNIVMSTCYQAAWEKLFKYMDIEPRLISPSSSSFKIEAEQVAAAEWQAAPLYVVDVAEVDDEFGVMELNPFSGADLYHCDPESVVDAASQVAERLFAEQAQ